MRTAAATAVAAIVAIVVAAGCGTAGLAEGASTGSGEELFVARCGSCHVLEAAGTQGQIGPNLDDGFGRSRADGLGESTIREVVHQQIYYPVENPPTGSPGMPPISQTLPECTGEEAEGDFCVDDAADAAKSIAAYVASVAGVDDAGGGAADENVGGEGAGG